MTVESAGKSRHRAAEEAAGWLVMLRADELNAAQRQEYVDWLRESPLHIAEMLRVTQVHDALGQFREWSTISGNADAAATNVVPFSPSTVFPNAPPLSRFRRIHVGVAVAASVLLAVTAGILVVRHPGQSTIRTAAGERSEVSLADGSVVEVAPSTVLHVQLADQERHVVIDRGQAFFHVHKDASRPFIVEASAARVRAVGTAFNVDHTGDGVLVTVTEGRVAVSANAHPQVVVSVCQPVDEAPVTVNAGQQLSVRADGAISAVRQVDGDSAIVWTTGQLEFENQTLGEVARRFNAFNHVQFEVRDPALSERRITGSFRLVDTESFAGFVQATIPGVAVHHEGNRIVITTESPADSPHGAP